MIYPAVKQITNTFGYYSGIFSTAVTTSVNPTATMATLATLGAIENAAIYSPDSAFFTTLADYLNSVPIICEASNLSIANPVAAVFLTLVAAVMIVVHSFSESKLLTSATIDKLDKFIGWLGITAMSLMPLVTNDKVDPKVLLIRPSMPGVLAVSNLAPWYMWVFGIGALVVATVIYSFVYDAFDNIGTICAAVPVKGLNIVEQVIKAILHAGLILIQIRYPIVSLIVSIIIAILGILLFGILRRLTTYYKEVYAKAILHRIFSRNKPVNLVHKKLPLRIKRKYKDIGFAIPLFAMKGIDKVKKRKIIWLIATKGEIHLITKKSFFRIRDISLEDLKAKYPDMVLIEYKRFMRLESADKRFSIVIGNFYKEIKGEIVKLLELY